MQGYNNGYGNYGVQNVIQRPTPGNGNTVWDNNWGGYNQMPQQSSDGKIYVNGKAGAEAYPIPRGMNQVILWDTDSRRFFIKGYDNNGMPRVLEDNDYTTHVDPEPNPQQNVDLSQYATKEDIRGMISNAFSSIQMPNMNSYMTKAEFEKILTELSVGNGGRIVRFNESNG